MKRALIALILPLATTLVADTNNTRESMDKNVTKENIVIKSSTIGHYQKPGAPVDITYATKKVDVNEIADVNVTFTTSLKSGDMDIDISFDKDLKPIEESFNKVVFQISPDQKEYKLNFKVTSSKEGLFYIRFLVKVKNGIQNSANMRAFAVPVYIGSGRLNKRSNQKIMRALSGENISVSKAIETIEPLNE
jgi:hypothetical protein